ncbi:sensor histidine kinase [Amycolatopsis cihanbeyliensis]|uniref:histidine kinase n=1 Tax=Amycolatopsis cihanbeyliensis TaxID=1128664 RepID=A0A542DFC9_AMYCI|nr:HAMP domain-containing sensor histidine kinase [Amycolatopsis cihanbeyliensis]TQJ01766.1 two-component system sensor histidine kinase MtrB [Amycolatopsis cihanbeyliensis]
MPRWLTGLRVRLLLAFVLVTVVGAVAAAWASYGSARGSLVSEAQQRTTEDVQRRVGSVAIDLTYPPDQEALDRLRSAVGGPALVTYGRLTSAEGADLGLLTGTLRAAVRERNALVLQRVTPASGPKLLVGTPVVKTTVDGERRPSGIEVYAVRDLMPTQQQIDASAQAAVRTSALALPLAIVLALLAARRVLRPVRELRGTARRFARGDLDVRLRVRGSDELAELSGTFNHMAAELQASVAELRRMETDARRFVADVSHELRTPLTTLTAVAEVLEAEAGQMRRDARDSTLLAVEETRKLTRLVEDLIEVSRFDAGAATLRLEDVDVGGAVEDCLRARGWGERVELDAPEEIGAVLDRRRLDVLVANLVGNALRHGRPPVRVRLRADEREVEVVVVDHGPGLPEGGAERVFARFYKADIARTRSEGSGLGLAIAVENARLHGGDIDAGNEPGAGARFVVRLPRFPEEDP